MTKSIKQTEIETETKNESEIETESIEKADIVGDISGIADMLAESAPSVQDHAILQHEEQQRKIQANIDESQASAPSDGLKDRHGNGFDASQHKVDADGKPVLTATGKLSLKAGRKAGATNTSTSTSKVGTSTANRPQTQETVDLAKIQKMRASGKGFANVVITAGIALGGDEWQTVKTPEYDERHMLESCFADYFEATGKDDLPPSVALAMGIAAYALPRFTMPATQSRAKSVAEKIAYWWTARKNKKLEAKVQKETDSQLDKDKAE